MIVQGADQLGKTLKTTVCIVGSGPAGCTAAWFLVRQGIDVILLDGAREKWKTPNTELPDNTAYRYNDNDLLYNGQTAGLMQQNESEFLIRPSLSIGNSSPKERERIYGGTGTHWGGQSRPLDPVVFEKRPGFPGWPVTRAEMDPYYDLACDFCCLYGDYYGPDGQSPGYNFTAQFWSDVSGYPLPKDLEGFDLTMYQFFQQRQMQAKPVEGVTIGERPEATVILNASALTTHTTNGSVSSVTVGVVSDDDTMAGTFTVEAQFVVLACGAVANARQLLLSGLGGDKAGRYFMVHPLANGLYPGAVTVSPQISSSLFSYPQAPYKVQQTSNTTSFTAKWVSNRETTIAMETSRAWFDNGGTGNFYHGTFQDPDSRVMLTDESDTDIFGQRRTLLNWTFPEPRSENNYNALTNQFATAVDQAYGYTTSVRPWSDLVPRFVVNGHHLGTTRMGWTADDSVVDANLQVHGVSGLYVAGSSVWASSGISNPTFSIITFSIRLADHIGKLLGKGGATRIRACHFDPTG